jgi:transposase
MAKAYPIGLRERVMILEKEGIRITEISSLLKVSRETIYKYKRDMKQRAL